MASVAGLWSIKVTAYVTAGLNGIQAARQIKATDPLASRIFEAASHALAAAALYVIGEGILPKMAFVASLQQAVMASAPFLLGSYACERAARALKPELESQNRPAPRQTRLL